jgi:hypothetical protein
MRVDGYAVKYKMCHLECFLFKRTVVMLRVLVPNLHCNVHHNVHRNVHRNVQRNVHCKHVILHFFIYLPMFLCRQIYSIVTEARDQMCRETKNLTLFYIYTGCPRGNVTDFGRVFLMLKYTDITQNTYIQNWTVTEIMTREKCGLLAVPRTVPVQLTRFPYTVHVLESVLVSGMQYFNSAGHSCIM